MYSILTGASGNFHAKTYLSDYAVNNYYTEATSTMGCHIPTEGASSCFALDSHPIGV